MAEIVNLRLARKRKARAEKEDEAARNRAVFGRSDNEKRRDAAEKEQARRHIDGHKKDE